jgi:hypothetical protein
MAAGRIVAVALAGWLAGCAGLDVSGGGADEATARGGAPGPMVAPAASDGPLAPFSGNPSLRAAGGWSPWILHASKRPTRYRTVLLRNERVLEASADSSASGLLHPLAVDPALHPILSWRWRIDAPLVDADVGERSADDAPVRIVLGFDGDKSTLPLRDQMFFERVKLLSGQDLPYATLMYVWDGRRAVESVTVNANTGRVRKIIVDSGTAGVRAWRAHRRDIVADFERAYGVKPGRLMAVGVMTDTDNTRQKARSWYGDIQLGARTH